MVERRNTMSETQYDRTLIFDSVKESVGLSIIDTTFDNDIRMHINATLSKLNQLGVGRQTIINDESKTTWDDFKDPKQEQGNEAFSMVPQFVFVSVRMLFDPPPPTTYSIMKEYKEELEGRLYIQYNQKVGEIT